MSLSSGVGCGIFAENNVKAVKNNVLALMLYGVYILLGEQNLLWKSHKVLV